MMGQNPGYGQQRPLMNPNGQNMMFNQDPPIGNNPKADPSQTYAQTVDGL